MPKLQKEKIQPQQTKSGAATRSKAAARAAAEPTKKQSRVFVETPLEVGMEIKIGNLPYVMTEAEYAEFFTQLSPNINTRLEMVKGHLDEALRLARNIPNSAPPQPNHFSLDRSQAISMLITSLKMVVAKKVIDNQAKDYFNLQKAGAMADIVKGQNSNKKLRTRLFNYLTEKTGINSAWSSFDEGDVDYIAIDENKFKQDCVSLDSVKAEISRGISLALQKGFKP